MPLKCRLYAHGLQVPLCPPLPGPRNRAAAASSAATLVQAPPPIIQMQRPVVKLLEPDPNQRLTIEGVKQHPFYRKGITSEALGMTAEFLQAPSNCRQSEEELLAVLAEAVGVLEADAKVAVVAPQAHVTV
mgnify:FL=1